MNVRCMQAATRDGLRVHSSKRSLLRFAREAEYCSRLAKYFNTVATHVYDVLVQLWKLICTE
ncbi:hypothetical protein T265_11069 [Opisthorchis viverrini]|uniref:Uncharacterized protein n=1 Tax=Opisthorchis viverrini TaxID=6198 RepID=A0A074Z0B7_OPIVI|nr:hypothetical protein T265_11069 [Opisthorchis viverrini]KER20373.1 hypothetical protein T265_11069 [Opisthorchis viverrini]